MPGMLHKECEVAPGLFSFHHSQKGLCDNHACFLIGIMFSSAFAFRSFARSTTFLMVVISSSVTYGIKLGLIVSSLLSSILLNSLACSSNCLHTLSIA